MDTLQAPKWPAAWYSRILTYVGICVFRWPVAAVAAVWNSAATTLWRHRGSVERQIKHIKWPRGSVRGKMRQGSESSERTGSAGACVLGNNNDHHVEVASGWKVGARSQLLEGEFQWDKGRSLTCNE